MEEHLINNHSSKKSIIIKAVLIILVIFFLVIYALFSYMKYDSEVKTIYQKKISCSYDTEYEFICTKTGYIYNVELEGVGSFIVENDKSLKSKKNIPIDVIKLYENNSESICEIYWFLYKDNDERLLVVTKNPWNPKSENRLKHLIDLQTPDIIDENLISFYTTDLKKTLKKIFDNDIHLLTDLGYSTSQIEFFLEVNNVVV